MKAKMSKKSTLTITIMACLLAVAVATTIVLAAFSANKQAQTTITFSNGVQIQVNGAYQSTPTAGVADPVSKTDITLIWACTETGATKNTTSATVQNVSNPVTFDAITFVNGNSTQSTTAWLIAKATITSSNATHQKAVIISRASTGWVQIGSTDWYAYGAAASGTTDATLESTAIDFTDLACEGSASFITAATISPANMTTNDPSITSPTIDDLAGASFTATVTVYAVNAGASDAQTQLASIISGS